MSEPDPEKPTPSDPEKKPEETKPEEKDPPKQDECQHTYAYVAVGTDRNSRLHIGTCSKCGAKTVAENCKFNAAPTMVPETCTKDGYYLYTCSVCKIDFEAQIWDGPIQTHKAKGHKFDSVCTYVADSDPGKHVRKCINDGCQYTEQVNCTLVAATEEGVCGGVKECKDCKHKVIPEDSNDSNGHKFAYTQTSDNQHTVRCTRSGCKYSETKECTFKVEKEEATCTTDGKETKTCECGRKIETKTPAKGHHFDSATGNYKGHTGTCTNCNEEVKEAAHKYGDSNLCLVCGWDGFITKDWTGYQTIPGRKDTKGYCMFKDSGSFKNSSVIILSESYMGSLPLTTIMNGSFGGNKNLTTVYIPASVTTIEAGAFSGCTNLKKVYFGAQQDDDKKLENQIKNEVGEGTSVEFVYGKTRDEVIKIVTGENDSSAATVFALPAEVGKRVYA